MSSILGAITRPPHATQFSSGAKSSTTFDDVSELDLSLVSTSSGSASVSLSSDLSGTSASTPTGKLAVGFAQALESATFVDPTTGEREIKSGKSGELVAALNALLMQNGFSQDQASQVTQSLTNELANGEPISLSSSYDTVASSSVSASGAYGANGVWTANSVTQTEQSGSLNISIDANGQLNVSLNAKTVSTAQYTGEVKGTGTAPSGPLVVIDMPGGDGSTGGIGLSFGAGGPTFASFGQATQAALSAMENAMPGALGQGASAPSGQSGIKETEVDAAVATALTAAMLVTTHTSDANGAQGNGDGAGDGTDSQSQANGASGTSATGQGAGAADSGTDPLSTLLSAVKSESDSLVQLLDAVSKTTLSGTKDAQKQLKDLLDIARQALDPNAANGSKDAHHAHSSGAGDASDASGVSGGSSLSDETLFESISESSTLSYASQTSGASSSVEILFTQTLSIQMIDEKGYGSTLYARPDGSLGKIVTQPTHVTA